MGCGRTVNHCAQHAAACQTWQACTEGGIVGQTSCSTGAHDAERSPARAQQCGQASGTPCWGLGNASWKLPPASRQLAAACPAAAQPEPSHATSQHPWLAHAAKGAASMMQTCSTCTPCMRPPGTCDMQAQAGSKQRVRRFGFARLHPLLQHAVSMDERQDVECTIRPVEDHLPADCLKLRVAPMRLRLATKSLVSLIVKILTITCAALHQECSRTGCGWVCQLCYGRARVSTSNVSHDSLADGPAYDSTPEPAPGLGCQYCFCVCLSATFRSSRTFQGTPQLQLPRSWALRVVSRLQGLSRRPEVWRAASLDRGDGGHLPPHW